MNIIDKKFNEFITLLKNKELSDIYNIIYEQFNKLPLTIKRIISCNR